MKRRRSPRVPIHGAFTFIEVFAALAFLAILVPAIVEGLTIANRASVAAERSEIAGQLAENKLNELVLATTTGTDPDATSSGSSGTGSSANNANSGDFGADYPDYRWETNTTTWDQDSVNTMTELSVQVFYSLQGRERSLMLTTLMSGSGTALSGSSTGSTSTGASPL